MTNGSLMKVESIAECQYFWRALSDYWSWKPNFGLFESGHFAHELWHDISSNVVCATSKAADQPADQSLC